MYKYKLKKEYIDDGERTFVGVGVTKEGVIESATPLESNLLELVSNGSDQVAATPAAQPLASATSAPQQLPTNSEEQK